jgi:flagellar hook-associated protein 3 FlgL
VKIDGAPANGDKFDVLPSGNQSVFTTLHDAINLLETPVIGNNAKITNGLRVALTNLDQALTNVSNQRGIAGAGLNELDQVQALGASRDLDLKSTLSSLEDIDYVKTVSEFTVTKTGLDAALSSYARIGSLSLFDYLR